MLTDVHTHNLHATDSIIAVGADAVLEPDRFYSVGIHPWDADETSSAATIEPLARDPRVIAIGETGLDRLRGASPAVQERLLREHAALSESLRKPLIIHSVRAHEDLIRLHRELRPTQPWIIHGFRGKPAVARRLLDQGFYISLGRRFNAETATVIPNDRLLLETDDDPTATISDVAADVAAARATTAPLLLSQASQTLLRLFPNA